MSLDQYLSAILKQISEMNNYSQVEAIIARMEDPSVPSPFPIQKYLRDLEARIENLSPLTMSSTQWSCFRYALICLRNISKVHSGKIEYI